MYYTYMHGYEILCLIFPTLSRRDSSALARSVVRDLTGGYCTLHSASIIGIPGHLTIVFTVHEYNYTKYDSVVYIQITTEGLK